MAEKNRDFFSDQPHFFPFRLVSLEQYFSPENLRIFSFIKLTNFHYLVIPFLQESGENICHQSHLR